MKVIFWLKTLASTTGYVEDHFTLENFAFQGKYWSEASLEEKNRIVKDWMSEHIEFGFEEIVR